MRRSCGGSCGSAAGECKAVEDKLRAMAADLKAMGLTKDGAIEALSMVWDRERPDDDALRKLQAARLREARSLRGFPSARGAQLRYGWSSAYGSHENGTREIGRMYRVYASKFGVKPAWLLGHSDERD